MLKNLSHKRESSSVAQFVFSRRILLCPLYYEPTESLNIKCTKPSPYTQHSEKLDRFTASVNIYQTKVHVFDLHDFY